MTVRYERAFSHSDRTVWIVYPAPSRVVSGQVGIQRFRDLPDLSEPSAQCRREIKAHFAWAAGTDVRNVRIVPY